MRTREEAAASCTKVLSKEECFRNKQGKVRAEHLVRCCLALGKQKASRKSLTELYVDSNFTEDREEWQKELQRNCEDVYTD